MMAKKKGNAIRPVGAKILIKRVSAEEKTQGGIIIPDSSQEKPLEGEVVAVGKGRLNNKGEITPLVLKKGDKVLFSKYGGNELSIGGDDLMIMEEHDVLAVIS
jgi:chaperonin GroES|tara:strand:+ start:7250 stop:7558 length:309 start_codon:yes stop_codon:yes gene_type:complete